MGAACPGMGSARAVPELQRVSEPPERRVSGLPEPRVWELPEPQRAWEPHAWEPHAWPSWRSPCGPASSP